MDTTDHSCTDGAPANPKVAGDKPEAQPGHGESPLSIAATPGVTPQRPETSAAVPAEFGHCTLVQATSLTPATLADNLKQLTAEQASAQAVFSKTLYDQGMFGKTFNFLKNNLGTSTEGRSVYNPLALWSNVLDYNSGSTATQARIDQAAVGLKTAASYAAGGDVSGYQQAIAPLLADNGTGGTSLLSARAVNGFQSSQINGTEGLQDMVVMGSAYMASLVPYGTLGRTISAAISGSLTKPVTKMIEGQSWGVSDVAAGGLIGTAGPLGRLAGEATTAGLFRAGSTVANPLGEMVMSTLGTGATAQVASKLGSALLRVGDFGAKQVGFMAEGTTGGAIIGAGVGYSQARDRGDSFSDSLAAAGMSGLESAKFGLITAGIIGAPLQLRSTWLTLPTDATRNGMSTPRFAQDPRGVGEQLQNAFNVAQRPGADFGALYLTKLNQLLSNRDITPLHWLATDRFDKFPKNPAGIGITTRPTLSARFVNLSQDNHLGLVSHELTHQGQTSLQLMRGADELKIGRSNSQEDIKRLSAWLTEHEMSIHSPQVGQFLAWRKYHTGSISVSPADLNRAKALETAEQSILDAGNGNSYNPLELLRRSLYKRNLLEAEAFEVQAKVEAAMGKYKRNAIPGIQLWAGTQTENRPWQ